MPTPTTQHITATIALAGDTDWTVASHGHGEPGSQITLGVGDILLFLRDRAAADTYTRAWLTGPAAFIARRLPERAALDPKPTAAAAPTLAVHATGRDIVTAWPQSGALVLRIGRLTWLVYDQAAYQVQQSAWTTVQQLADIVLPGRAQHPNHRPRKK